MIVGQIFALLALIGIVAIFVWLVKLSVWLVRRMRGYERARTSHFAFRRGRHPIHVLEDKLVNGEIDAAEFEEKRKLLLADKGSLGVAKR